MGDHADPGNKTHSIVLRGSSWINPVILPCRFAEHPHEGRCVVEGISTGLKGEKVAYKLTWEFIAEAPAAKKKLRRGYISP
jgi:hypothetical protein